MVVLRSTEDHNLSLVNVYNDKYMFGIEDHNLSLVRVHCHNLFLVLKIVTLVLLRFNVISLCLRSRIITLVFFRFSFQGHFWTFLYCFISGNNLNLLSEFLFNFYLIHGP